MDKAVMLQTAIMKSTRDRLKEIQEEHKHETLGETIFYILEKIDDLETSHAEPQVDAVQTTRGDRNS